LSSTCRPSIRLSVSIIQSNFSSVVILKTTLPFVPKMDNKRNQATPSASARTCPIRIAMRRSLRSARTSNDSAVPLRTTKTSIALCYATWNARGHQIPVKRFGQQRLRPLQGQRL
jgi:hypothetical protein